MQDMTRPSDRQPSCGADGGQDRRPNALTDVVVSFPLTLSCRSTGVACLSRLIHGGDGERAALRSANWIWTPVPSTVQLYLADSARR